VNVNYINPFLEATKEVFDTMVHLPVSMGKPYLRRVTDPKFDVSAAIGISGDVSGSVILSFPLAAAVAVASGLAGTPLPGFDQDGIDALGEVANMIAGSAKVRLPGQSNKLSLPNVVMGQHRVAMPSGVPIIIIPCQITLASTPKVQSVNFIIEVAFRNCAVATAKEATGKETPVIEATAIKATANEASANEAAANEVAA
jgi:chemotaxis protein CheX